MSKRIQDITLLKFLGKGAFGTVYLSTKDGKNCYYATKQIDRAIADRPNFRKYFKTELRLLQGLNHPNIVHLEDLKYDNKYYYVVMEYINGGSLSECLKKYKLMNGKSFSEDIVQYLMRQIVSAVKFIHSKNIIHRDLKLDNIMVNFNNDYDKANCNMLKSTIKIIDFGLAIQLTQNHLATSVLGSPANMDPLILKEMVNRGKKITKLGYDQKADIWSLGTICYQLLIGQYVFNAETMNELLKKVETGNYSVPTSVSYEVVSFLNGMLQYKGEKRLNADELSKHPFLVKNVRDFQRINIRRVEQKINENGLNINVKKNQTIWSIFNEDDEKKLLNINVKNQNIGQVKQMPQYSYDNYKRTNTDLNIPRINKNNNIINPPPNKNYNKIPSSDYGNYQPYSKYGMNPIPKPQHSPNYNKELAPPFVSFNSTPIPTQKTSYSSGAGGYNKSDYPTFDPAPYTFASEIYCPNPDQSQGAGFIFDSNPQVTGHFGTGSINEEPNNPNNEDVCSIQ